MEHVSVPTDQEPIGVAVPLQDVPNHLRIGPFDLRVGTIASRPDAIALRAGSANPRIGSFHACVHVRQDRRGCAASAWETAPSPIRISR